MSSPEKARSRPAPPVTNTDVVDKPGWLRARLWIDLRESSAAALLGCGAFAAIDYAATLWAAPAGVRLATALRLVFLELTLAALLLCLVAPLFCAATVAVRLALRVLAPMRASRWPGFFGPPLPRLGPGALAPWLWALALCGGVYLAGSTVLTLTVSKLFKEPQLTALVLAMLQVGLFSLLALAALLAARGVRWLGRRLDARLGRANPFGAAPAALATLVCVVALPALWVTTLILPQLGPLIPWRHIVAVIAIAAGASSARVLYGRRRTLLPAAGRRRLAVGGAAIFAATVLIPVTLLKIGADPDTKALAVSSSPPMASIMDTLRRASDFDGDGFGTLLGENDCGPFDPNIHPLARDIPDNGVDENCNGSDFRLGALPTYRKGERMPVPDAYDRPYNILLITVDTLRYDHTGFGGYAETSGRETTPQLDRFVERAVSFAFANAPSAGTMASVPAILTSKFFHSGIALDEDVKRGMPPKLTPENTLISEILKEKGYTTGAILSHYYFNDWGMEQGFDTYDNSIGAKNEPRKVTSHLLTDRAIAWIGKRSEQKWFLWVHYLDPHGYYVAHPGERSFGTTEKDLYDGEIYFTDKHLGRLLDYVARSEGGDRTAIFLTSDHGDAFREHGFINHGQDLYREILHVPLIAYVPNIEPRVVEGAVSPIDIFPTIADLVGADVSHLGIEGESLVPQLFYGRDAHDRVVFAETNYRNYVRAAVTSRYKLILDLHNNVYRFFNLEKDPWEKKNVRSSPAEREAFETMQGYLSEWLERVYYARDPKTNQAMAKLRDNLVPEVPEKARSVGGVSFDEGRIEVVGIETDEGRYAPGETIEVAVYFRTTERPSGDFKLQVSAWPENDPGARPRAHSSLRVTAKGLLPTGRWRDGELIRDRFEIRLPATWEPGPVQIGIRMTDRSGKAVAPAGPTRPDNRNIAVLTGVEIEAPAGAQQPADTAPAGAQPARAQQPAGKAQPARKAPARKQRPARKARRR